jgi:hypothetical protein
MRRIVMLIGLLTASVPCSAYAQDWETFSSVRDGFQVDFPGQPKITETTWKTRLGYVLPARVFSVDKGTEHYSMTVVDYTTINQLGAERAKACPPGNQQCRETAPPVLGVGYSNHDERGAIMWATLQLLKRDAKVTDLDWEWQDMIEGNFVQFVNNADQSRTMAWISMHEHKLYVLEGTVPQGYPQPALFQQSMQYLDAQGHQVRYQGIIYSNAYHGMGVYPRPPYGGYGAPGGANGASGGGPAPANNGSPPGQGQGRP